MKKYRGNSLDLVAYPLGGTGAGMLCINGNGGFGNISIRNKPDVNFTPNVFSAITIIDKDGKNISKVVEAPIAKYKIFAKEIDSGNGLSGKNYGLPRFNSGEFMARFPYANIHLSDNTLPLSVDIVAWSPFIPNDEDRSGYPFVGVEYIFKNISENDIDAVYYFNASNFMKLDENSRIKAIDKGFILEQDASAEEPHKKGAFCACINEDTTYVDTAWFRGGWFDTLTMLWNNINDGVCQNKLHDDMDYGQSAGATLSVPFKLKASESKKIKLKLSWYVPNSNLRYGNDCNDNQSCCCKKNSDAETYVPWYTTVLSDIEDTNLTWCQNYNTLYKETRKFTKCFYNTTLPDEIIDAVSANLSILKSPTILRQTDGRIWAWEGCCDTNGCCAGTCTHVWNYAQSLCHLFPHLELGLRQTEFYDMQDDYTGHQEFRAYLPIRKAKHNFHAASDGQLGGIIKVYREWRICGDNLWLKTIWLKVKESLNFCIKQWDPKHEGVLTEPHHNTYDIEFWGPDAMCSSFYIGALKAATIMAKAVGDKNTLYQELYNKGRKYLNENLYNGEYYYQKVMRDDLKATFTYDNENSETKKLLEKEGPKYQYGTGCLSDGILGVWLSEVSGLNDILDDDKVISHLCSIYNYNYKSDLSAHANPQRPGYAIGNEAGLLLCTWPNGGKPSLPFVYSDEVWTGIEYQVASHLMIKGHVDEALNIVGSCRKRYDGIIRNPFNEYECGHWYARAMASYSLLYAYTGVRYDNVNKTLYANTKNTNNFKTFLSTATGYATVEMVDGKVTVNVISGYIDIDKIAVD